MSGYRDELDAAQARITHLEDELARTTEDKDRRPAANAHIDVDNLARRGQETRANERKRQLREVGADERRALRRAWAGSTPFGVLYAPLGGFLVAGATFAVSLLAGLWLALGSGLNVNGVIVAIVPFALSTATVVGGRWLALRIGARAYPKVLAWSRSLPFMLVGLDTVLVQDPKASVSVDVRFLKRVDLEKLADAVRGLKRRHLEARVGVGALEITQGHLGIDDDMGANEPGYNYPVLRFVRWLMKEFLIPLHASTPILDARVH